MSIQPEQRNTEINNAETSPPRRPKVRILVDTCFWIGLAGLDVVDHKFTDRQKKERFLEANRAFKYMTDNRINIEIVSSSFTRKELDNTLEKLYAKAESLGYPAEYIENMKKKETALRNAMKCNVMEYKLNSWKYIQNHPELPLPPQRSKEDPTKLVSNPDRHLFASCEMLQDKSGGFNESIILTFDRNHVVSAGTYKGIKPMEPEFLKEEITGILYKNGLDEKGNPLVTEENLPEPEELIERANMKLFEKIQTLKEREAALQKQFEENRNQEIDEALRESGQIPLDAI